MATMMKRFSRVGEDGKVAIPHNMQRQAGLHPGQMVEVKLLNGKSVVITVKHNAVS